MTSVHKLKLSMVFSLLSLVGTLAFSVNAYAVFQIPTDPINCAFNGELVVDGSSVTAYPSSSVPFGSLCVPEVRTCTRGVLSGSATNVTCTVAAPVNCSLNGSTINSGSNVTAWTTASVPFGSQCVSEVRTCTNGVLSGSATNASCSVDPAASCNLNGATIESGATATAWTTASVPFGSQCVSEVRTCTNGVLSGSATNASCSVQPAASCSLNGSTIASGSTATAWTTASVPFGSQCVSEVRTCTNGVLSGSATNATCSVQPAASCSLNGSTINSGSNVTAWTTASVAFGSQCVSEVRTCTNGVLSGSATNASCSVEPAANCTLNGSTINSGATVTAWTTSSVPFGSQCVSEVRTCINGFLSGTASNASCTVDPNLSCSLNGETINNGSSVTVFTSSHVPVGSSCSSVSEVRVCKDGVLSGSATLPSCTVDAPASCSFNDKDVANGEFVTAFQNSTVSFGRQCVSEQRKCLNGQLDGSYNFPSCEVGGPASCTFNGNTIAHEGTVTAFIRSNVAFGSTCSTVAEVRTCNNGVLSGSAQFASCDVGAPASCLFNGATVAHGDTVVAYPSSTTQFGSRCEAEKRTCSNGVLSGTAKFGSCTVDQPASCLFNGKTIAHGQIVKAFTSATVPNGQQCVQQDRTCNNGVLSGNATAESCAVLPPVNPPPQPTPSLWWEFPEACGCNSGQGYNGSKYSKDSGKTWITITKTAPADLQAVWDYMAKKYGLNKCKRPNVKYQTAWHKGYVKFDSAYLPKKCGFVEVVVKSSSKHKEHGHKNHHGRGHHDGDRDDDDDDRDDDKHGNNRGHGSRHGMCQSHNSKRDVVEIKYVCEK